MVDNEDFSGWMENLCDLLVEIRKELTRIADVLTKHKPKTPEERRAVAAYAKLKTKKEAGQCR